MKKISLYVMLGLYVIAGINHFMHPAFYFGIMPPWVPFHAVMVFISGVCEVLFALLLLFPGTRKVAAWCIMLLLVAIFPANVQMLLNFYKEQNSFLWLAILRLPLQIVLIWWAYSFTKQSSIKAP